MFRVAVDPILGVNIGRTCAETHHNKVTQAQGWTWDTMASSVTKFSMGSYLECSKFGLEKICSNFLSLSLHAWN